SFTLLRAFGVATARFGRARTLTQAHAVARELHFPVALTSDSHAPGPYVRGLRTYAALSRAWNEMRAALRADPPEGWRTSMLVIREQGASTELHAVAGMAYDTEFGPVITLRPDGVAGQARAPAMTLPPLNRPLAADLIVAVPELAVELHSRADGSNDALAVLLTRLSTMVCVLPWVRQVELQPLRFADGVCVVAGARIVAEPRRTLQHGYRHMAIHPYPTELIEEVTLSDGNSVLLRPIRPEDAELEREFVQGLSDEARYMRFFHRMQELTPAMLARFTQVDYDRELALVALASDPKDNERSRFIGVARYIANPDRESAEFAVVVADDFQRRGVARLLMLHLMKAARDNGFKRLEGAVLRVNRKMLDFTASLGFAAHDGHDDPDQVIVSRQL
ncbi:MAG TPA: GNAT family N-acetyltransferase, partial [Casimicrobiaceae bacterium]|nr:GNAT family N-acetyltransferase [Casimicrobiaceae bacterium]